MSDTEIQQLRDRITQLEAVITEMTSGAHRRPDAGWAADAGGDEATRTGAEAPASRRGLLKAAAAAAGAAVVTTAVVTGTAEAASNLQIGGFNSDAAATEADCTTSAACADFLFQSGVDFTTNGAPFTARPAVLVGSTVRAHHPTAVLGYTEVNPGTGVWGLAAGTQGQGVRADGPTGLVANSTTATGTAVLGTGDGGYGVRGISNTSVGVVGNSTSSLGVYGAGDTGVQGNGATVGVRGEGLVNGDGVQGVAASSGTGVDGTSTDGIGVFGHSTAYYGTAGLSVNHIGVYGEGATAGVTGHSSAGGVGVGALVTGAGYAFAANAPDGACFVGNGHTGIEVTATAASAVVAQGTSGVAAGGDDFAFIVTSAGRAAVLLRSDTPAGGHRAAPPSRSDAHEAGELDFDTNDDLWLCVAAGSPGTWRKLSGATAAGAFHAVTPGRVYDSRLAVPGPAAPLAGGSERTVSVRDRRSVDDGSVALADFVPAGATAISANVTVVDTVGAGFLTANPGGVHDVGAATINWSASGQILNNGVILTLDANRELNVIAGPGPAAATHVVIDVTGYYR